MLQLSPNKKRLIFKILPYPAIFLIGGWMYVNIEFGLLGETDIYPASRNVYDPFNSMLTITSMNIVLGLALGIIEEAAFKSRFKQLPFTLKIFLKTLLYILIFVAMLFVFSVLLNAMNSEKTIIDPYVHQLVFAFFTTYAFISIIIYASFIIGLSLFFTEIVDYLGIDIVSNFFSGKYSKPVNENRIFMFLDMKNSTAIAERIGHKKHYKLINEYYSDMSDAIVETKGLIYQYVGDEIVVSWKLEEGLKDCNCLKCFFMIEKSIERKSADYLSKYGAVPGFKAGYHYGEVTRGQVGQIKRDLLYIGDVLNATARIQGLCKQLNVNLLISAPLRALLPKNNFSFTLKGEFELRGRQRQEELFAVELGDNSHYIEGEKADPKASFVG